MGTSLRDHAATLTGSTAAILLTKDEQQAMIHGLRRQGLAQIRQVVLSSKDKVHKYDRIVEILESTGGDIQRVLATPTVD